MILEFVYLTSYFLNIYSVKIYLKVIVQCTVNSRSTFGQIHIIDRGSKWKPGIFSVVSTDAGQELHP